ncbi:MAG: hypothetical protein IKO13_07205 [Oscillospiraceae bacterium]|nr:hypothetical protein [Oscillospiraceae bacterium]
MSESSAYIVPKGYNFNYHFAGVVEIEYNFALNINADPENETDVVNGARKLPSQIRLSVIETDVSHNTGWSAGMLQAMEKLRNARTLCTVVTSMGSWSNMLLSEVTATQDEENQIGWAGDLVFMQCLSANSLTAGIMEASTRKTENNSATARNIGTKGPPQNISGSVVQQTISRGGGLGTVLIAAQR